MAPSTSDKPKRTALDNQLSFKRLDTISRIVCEFIKWAGLLGIAYLAYRSVEVLAGKNTFADIGFKVIGNVKVSDGIIVLLTGGGWAYGLAQRSLRRRYIERNTSHKNDLERIIDPNRTSSNLTPRGTTPTRDGEE